MPEHTSSDASASTSSHASGRVRGELRTIRIGDIQIARGRVRRDLGDLGDLAASIYSTGLNNPITVRELGSGGYRLIAGERRLRATMSLGAEQIDAIVREVEADDEELVIELMENLARRDLSDEDEADGFITLVRDKGYEVSRVAHQVGRSAAYVSKRVRVFEQADLRQAIASGQIGVSEAEELLIVDDLAVRADLLRRARAEAWERARLRAEIRTVTRPAEDIALDDAAPPNPDASAPASEPGEFRSENDPDPLPPVLQEIVGRPEDLSVQIDSLTQMLTELRLLDQLERVSGVLRLLRPWQLTAEDDAALGTLFVALHAETVQGDLTGLVEALRRLAQAPRERRPVLPSLDVAEAEARRSRTRPRSRPSD